MWRRLYDATFNRPFYDGARMRRRYSGERRGYNIALIGAELVGSALVMGIVAVVLSPFRRLVTKKKTGSA